MSEKREIREIGAKPSKRMKLISNEDSNDDEQSDSELDSSKANDISHNPEYTNSDIIINSLITAMETRSASVGTIIHQLLEEYENSEEKKNNVYLKSSICSSDFTSVVLSYLEYLSVGKPTDAQKVYLFRLLELILLNLACDQNEHCTLAFTIVKKILTSFSELLKRTISHGVKSTHVKSVFKLLIAMVSISPGEVLSSFNLSMTHLFKHLNNRDNRDVQDLRTCIIHFILSFLIFGDIFVIRELCEKRDLLTCPFPGLKNDKANIIILFLKTLKEKIIQNLAVSKSAKVHIFSVKYIKNVVALFNWSGPQKWSKKSKFSRMGNEKESLLSENEDINNVHTAATDFLTELFSSYKYGIIFRQISIKSDNQNYMVAELLKSVENPFESAHKSQLISSVLSACPYQILNFYPIVKHSFEPRDSPIWFSAMGFLINILSNFDFQSILSNTEKEKFDKLLSKKLLLYLGISLFTKEHLKNALTMDCLPVKIKTLEFLLLTWSKTTSIINYLKNAPIEVVENSSNLIEVLKVTVINVLPTPLLIFPDVSAIKESYDKKDTKSTLLWLTMSIKLLNEMYGAFPDDIEISSIPVLDLLSVLEFVDGVTAEGFNEAKVSILKLCTIKLERDQTLLKYKRDCNVVYILLKHYVTMNENEIENQILNILKFYLGENEVITESLNEVKLWISILKQGNVKVVSDTVVFLWKALLLVLTNPSIYIDKCVEFQNKHNELEYSALKLKRIENISLYRCVNPENKFFFSPLLPAVLEMLNATKPRKLGECISYMEKVVTQILHRSSNPGSLCSLLIEYEKYLSDDLKEYLIYFLPHSKLLKIKKNTIPSEMHTNEQMLKAAFYVLCCKRDHFESFSVSLHLHSIKKNMTLTLSMQCLLYLQMELEKVLTGAENIGAKWFLSVLEKMIKKCSEPCISEILKHSVLQNWFVICTSINSGRTTREILECVVLITNLVTRLLDNSLTLNSEVKNLYKSKTLLFIDLFCFQVVNDGVDLLRNCSNAFIKLASLYTIDELVYSLNAISQCDLFVKSGEFSVLNELLKCYLQKSFEDGNSALLMKTVNSIFKMPQTVTGDDKSIDKQVLDQLMLQLLEFEPRYCSAIDPNSAVNKLDPSNVTSIKLFIYLSQQSPAHHFAFRQWVEQNSESLALWPYSLVAQMSVTLLSHFSHVDKYHYEVLPYIAKEFWKIICTVALGDNTDEEHLWCSIDIGFVLWQMVEQNLLSLNDLCKLANDVLSRCKKQFPTFMRFFTTIEVFKCIRKKKLSSKASIEAMLVQIILYWLSCVVKMGKTNELTLKMFLKTAISFFKELPNSTIVSSISNNSYWNEFISNSFEGLEIGESELETFLCVFDFIQCVCEKVYSFGATQNVKEFSVNPSSKNLFDTIFENALCKTILLEEFKEVKNPNDYLQVKNVILNTLSFLVLNDYKIFEEDHLKFYLQCYRATMRDVDQKLLSIMKLYEINGISLGKFRPFYWGKAAVDQFSLQNLKANRIVEFKLDDILNCIRRDFVMNTSLHFPIDLELSPIKVYENTQGQEYTVAGCENPELNNIFRRMYDPRFLIPLLSNLMAPSSVVNCSKFVHSNCLILCFAALSSSCDEMRAVAYLVLTKFYHHLESSLTYKDGKVYLTLLELLIDSVNKENKKMPNIISNFLVKTSIILAKPDDPLYQTIYEYLLFNSKLEIDIIPNFYRMFFSKDQHHEQLRTWIVNVIKDGFKTNLDFQLCQKSFVFNSVILLADSSLSSISDKLRILEFLIVAMNNRAAAFTLYRNHNILAWINSNIIKEPDDVCISSYVNLMHRLWLTSLKSPKQKGGGKSDDFLVEHDLSQSHNHPFNASFPSDFIVTHLSLLRLIRSTTNIEALTWYLETLLGVTNFLVKSEGKLCVVIKGIHVEYLLELLSKTEENKMKDIDIDFESGVSSKHTEFVLNIICLVSPKLSMGKSLLQKVFSKMIENSTTELVIIMKWLRICLDQNPTEVVNSVMTEKTSSVKWRKNILDRFVKCLSIPRITIESEHLNCKLSKEQIKALLLDMITVGRYAAQNSLVSEDDIEETCQNLEKHNQDLPIGTDLYQSSFMLTLQLWSP